MSEAITQRIVAAMGHEAVRQDAAGRVHVLPPSADAVAALFGLASEAGWRIVVRGASTWQADHDGADIIVSLRALDAIAAARPTDLVVTAQAGAPLDRVQQAAHGSGTWIALDAPGRADRTVGSVLATATAGPLRHAFGPVRDQVLGLTVVTGDGRVVRSGGTTVKNVAGFDLVKLHVGGFGAFGVITECHLRLRALPRADTTWVALGERDRLTGEARRLYQDGAIDLAALELMSPALGAESNWMLAARFAGGPDAVSRAEGQLTASQDVAWRQLVPEQGSALWNGSARAMTTVPVTLRLGVVPEGLEDTLDLIVDRLGEGMMSAGARSGSIRWSGHADAAALRDLRLALAPREIPLTLERAPWPVQQAVGHFGAYHEGVGGLVDRLRASFDPRRVLVSALDGEVVA